MHRPSLTLILFVFLAIALPGCGAEQYDRRFAKNTKPFLNDQAELNRNLTSDWSAQSIHLRLPEGFTEDPLPSEGPLAVKLPDQQIIELPGLMGVFSREVAAITPDGQTLPVPARIAVLSNRELRESRETQKEGELAIDPGEPVDPAKFQEIVWGALAEALPTNATKPDALTIGGRNFQPTLRYDRSRFEATGGSGIGYEVELFTYADPHSSTQVAIVVMVPNQLEGSESLETQVPLSLRTLRVQEPGTGSGPTASDAAAGPNF